MSPNGDECRRGAISPSYKSRTKGKGLKRAKNQGQRATIQAIWGGGMSWRCLYTLDYQGRSLWRGGGGQGGNCLPGISSFCVI